MRRTAVLTPADGPVVAPAHIAVRHPETADALRALQFITFVAGEMHRGASPAVRQHSGGRRRERGRRKKKKKEKKKHTDVTKRQQTNNLAVGAQAMQS